MSLDKRQAFLESYPHRLQELRLKIDSVPEELQPHFRSAVDEAERRHDQMQKNSSEIADMVGDLRLMVEYANFHVEACRRELREVDPHGRFQL